MIVELYYWGGLYAPERVILATDDLILHFLHIYLRSSYKFFINYILDTNFSL